MAVGPNFSDPETQAAIAAQSGAPVQPSPNQDQDATVQDGQIKDTPAAAEPSADAQKPAKSDGDDLNMGDQGPEQDVDAQVKEAGFDTEALGKELADNDGSLTEETEKALREKFGDEKVDAELTTLKAKWDETAPERQKKVDQAKATVDQMNDYIFESLAGGDAEKGRENFNTLSAWCKSNMDPAEVKAINLLLSSGDKEIVTSGLKQAVAAWKKGSEKPMMTGDAAANAPKPAEEVPYISRDQYRNIVASDKYNTDAEYAAKIDKQRRTSMEKEAGSFRTPEYSKTRPPIR